MSPSVQELSQTSLMVVHSGLIITHILKSMLFLTNSLYQTSHLREGEQCNYRLLCKAPEQRFSQTNQTELYRAQLHERRQKSSKSLTEFGQDIRWLTKLSYLTTPVEVRQTLFKEQFIDILREKDMCLRVRRAKLLKNQAPVTIKTCKNVVVNDFFF